MALEPVNTVLGKFRKAQWKQQREFGKLQHAWSEVVGPAVAAQAQPTQITAQQVLLVATSSAVWAQNLAFERQRLLIKLNDLLDQPLTDIRFSTSQWRSRSSSLQSAKPWTPKSLVTGPENVVDSQTMPDYREVFLRWSERVKAQSQSYPPCPQCGCATPPAELQRWSVCGLCAVRPQESDASPQSQNNVF
jgi:predicted nucleic acid-binding Zn ribbon protein